MRQVLRGFLLIIISIVQVFAWAQATAPSSTVGINLSTLMLATNTVPAANNMNSSVVTDTDNTDQTPAAPTRSTVDPRITQQTQNIFQNTQQNLSLYVTQLQCQSQGINTNSCNSQNNTTNNAPTLMNNVNKFLFNSVTSELGVGVEVNF